MSFQGESSQNWGNTQSWETQESEEETIPGEAEIVELNCGVGGVEDEEAENSGDESDDADSVLEWEELSTEPDTEIDTDGSDNDESLQFNMLKGKSSTQFGDLDPQDGELCICKTVVNKEDALGLINKMIDITPNYDNHACFIDNIIRSYNVVFSNNAKPMTSSKIAFTDLFYRFRHESLFKCLCLSFNLPVGHSDMPFTELGIDSKRTPDLIVIEGDVVKIIEVTAVSSIEKAAQNKGMDIMGFESKYKREIDMLSDKGKTCIYLPVFFDMSDPNNAVNKEQIHRLKIHFPHFNVIYYTVLETYAKHLAIVTNNMKKTLILPSAILFSDVKPIESRHKSLEFLYTKSRLDIKSNKYKELVVSPYVYNKIMNDRDRLFSMLDNNKYTDKAKVIFVINTLNHRITLESNELGSTINEIRQIMIDNRVTDLLSNIKLRSGGIVLDSTQSETGVKFYVKTNEVKKTDPSSITNELLPLVHKHTTTGISGVLRFNKTQYRNKITDYTKSNYHSKHYDPGYEDKIINSIVDFDMKDEGDYHASEFPNLLGNLRSEEIDIDVVMDSIREKYKKKNSFNEDTLPIVKPKMKQPFLLPIANLNATSYCQLDHKNHQFIVNLSRVLDEGNPFTSLILKHVIEDKYNMYNKTKAASSTLNGLISERHGVSNKINLLQKELIKSGSIDQMNQLSKTSDIKYSQTFAELKGRFKTLNKEINNRKKMEGIGSTISYIRLPCKGRSSPLRQMYDFEMAHFKDRKRQSTIEGVGIINNIESDYESDLNLFQNLISMMTEDRGHNPDKVLHEYVSPDASLIYDLKKASMDRYTGLINQVRNSYLGHSAALVSRIAHTLMFYSQMPFNSDLFRVDNLGYKNVLLIVRGGKKIFKSKSSKLFRIIYPISEEIVPLYQQGHQNRGSFRVLNINGETYGMTPWSFWHESILTDSISFYSRISSFTFLNLEPNIDLKAQFSKVALNVLLGFHNRRQTEVMLANMRYILLSTLGDFTGVSQILPEFFDFNYDRFQSFIRNSLLINYPSYFKSLQMLKSEKRGFNKDINVSEFVESRLRNIFTLEVIYNVEELALMIYSTFLMTKAPYQKVAERARNLRGILEIHNMFDKEVGLGLSPEEQTEKLSVCLEGDFKEYTHKLFENDFKFDPKFCALVGNFVNSIFINNKENEDIETSWIKIMNQPWDEMATSTGLRGDYDLLEDFWGQKGYFVIYKSLLSEPGFSTRLLKVFNSDLDDDMKRRIIRDMNELFKDKFLPDREFLIFHAVDKVQWRGGREIYVMDLMTKTMQQPIEKFMAVLCKKLDNELISIPSDRRAQVIHHAIFEKDLPLKDTLTWYLTLDCSKWAPKSIFVKFVIMILNMPIIPQTFKTHFMNYIEKLYSKRIYFNVSEVEALKKNNKYKEVCEKYLILDKNVNGYYLEMPYSWVMGIFNYTSSFLHAANQKYFSYILMNTTLISYKEECSLVMFAHSDDSGGRLTVSSISLAKRALVLYEIFLKSCNHLLSKKKSVVSRIYFEILSVIYLFKKLLALLPKFLGGLRFLPTDKGPAQDMLQSYSKSIEVMVAGSDFAVSYLVLKVYSYIVWNFYYHKEPSEIDYERPVQYLGLPDSHPLFILLCGSDADILRLIRNGTNLVDLITFVNTMSSQMDGEGPIKPLRFEIKVKGIKKGFEDFIDSFSDILKSWSIRNVNYHNTGLNTLSFLRKLNDSGFVGSLVNESTVRRISRGYFIRNGCSAITRFKNMKLSTVMDSLVLCQSYSNKNSALKHVLNDFLDEEDVSGIEEEFSNNREGSERMYLLLKETLKSPLNIYKYLDIMKLEGRKLNPISRTMKPTHVQLVKSAKVFSSDFDPSSLVSYIKEADMRWALPNVKGIFTAHKEVEKFLTKLGYNFDEVDADMLLRVCRTYGRENTKNIYIYSRVPGEIRQIKTYSAFLTFLSVNSFSNIEISGLTIKMDEKEMGKEYLAPNLIEEVYTVNNVISLILTMIEKCGVEFVRGLKTNELTEINWPGGSIIEMLDYIGTLSVLDVRYTILNAQLCYLKHKFSGSGGLNGDILNESAYYTFLKSQKSRGGWYGKGEVYIKIDNNFYSFIIENSDVVKAYTNKTGKLPQHHVEFIMDIFENISLSFKHMKKPKPSLHNDLFIGYDNSGDISILKGREIELGVPCTNLSSRNDYIDDLSLFTIVSYHNNCMNIRKGFENDYIYRKIQLIPVKRSELVGTIKMLFDPGSFEDKIMELGVSDFEEFIYTEILTEYGKNVYVDFYELFDNYAGSELYKVYRTSFEESYSEIPKKITFSPLPASSGSMVRILIDYSSKTGENLMKVPINLDATIMQLRSEYPEMMSTIMGDKLESYHKQIYSPAERKEISDSYNQLYLSEDINQKRIHLIKLMTYWGYGSFVNSVKTFTLTKEISNYEYFNTTNLSKNSLELYSSLYEEVIQQVVETINGWRGMFKSLEYPLTNIVKYSNLEDICTNYLYYSTMSCYEYKCLGLRPSLYLLQFSNLLMACMGEEDFVAELQDKLSKNYIMTSLPISWNSRFELMATINVLNSVWCSRNKVDFVLDYSTKLQRLKSDIQQPKVLGRKIGLELKPSDAYYHGFVNDLIISYILGLGEVTVQNVEYRINTKISRCSDIEVNMCPLMKHKRPLTGDLLEDPAFEDLNYEASMPEPDEDEIQIIKEDISVEFYKPSVTKKLKIKNRNIITSTVHWIIEPNLSSKDGKQSYFRQVSENIAVVTDTYMYGFTENFPNAGCRLVNYSKAVKARVKPFFIFYSLGSPIYNDEFIKCYFGGMEYRLDDVSLLRVKPNYLRNDEGLIVEPQNLGGSNLIDVIVGENKLVDKEGVTVNEKVDKEAPHKAEVENEEDRVSTKLRSMSEELDKIEKSSILSREGIKNLKDKYMKTAIRSGLPLTTLLKSMLIEKDLIKINEEILSNSGSVSATDQKKMFLAPEYFGMAKGSNRNDMNPIKNKKVRSEINSFTNDLASAVGSNTLKLSNKFSKIVLANIKMWIMMIKNSSVKTDNKRFLLTVIFSIANNVILSDDEGDDTLWQEIINKAGLYITSDDEEEDEDDLFAMVFSATPASRIRYRAEGT